ncbi:Phasin protein [Hyphomicrobiales bacterium]|nr:Phasin protein [Hyphomicrobiales bacterium]CAH1672022.1 Phasin protein [Hyphomicrobiales bacterium]
MDKRKTPDSSSIGKIAATGKTASDGAPAAKPQAGKPKAAPAQKQPVPSKAIPAEAATSTSVIGGAPKAAAAPKPAASQSDAKLITPAKPQAEQSAPATVKATEAKPAFETKPAAPSKPVVAKPETAAATAPEPTASKKPNTPTEPAPTAHAAIVAQAEATLRQTEALSKLAEEAVAASLKAAQASASQTQAAARKGLGLGQDHQGQEHSSFATIAGSGLQQARQAYATAQEQRDTWNRSVIANANVASKAANEINGKILDLLRSQTDATFGLWRSLMNVTSIAEAVELQTRELRRQYEDATARVRDIAETATRYSHDVVSTAKETNGHR